MAFLVCGACQKPVEIHIDQPRIINSEHCSILIIDHEGETACPCGAVIVPMLQGIAQVKIIGLPVPPEKRRKLIVPPGQSIA